jgi:hypothetical protein
VNIQAQTLLIIVGLLLILSVLVLNIRFGDRARSPAPAAAKQSAAPDQPDKNVPGGVS